MAIDSFTPVRVLDTSDRGIRGHKLPDHKTASIVVVSYNSRAHLERCLRSVITTIGSDCEVIVVDNASTDGSADFVASRFPFVKLVRNERNRGFAAGNNLGASHASGRYIIGLNPDTQVTPGWLEALLAPLQAANSDNVTGIAGITTGRILMMDRPGEVNTCGNITHLSGITTCRGLGRPAGAPDLQQQVEVPAMSGACFAITRALWEQLGGFDESFFTYLEDTDLSLRARLLGYTTVYTPGAVVHHSYTGSFSARKLYYLERNRLMMLAKIYRKGTLLAMLPALAIAESVTWAYALKGGNGHIASKLGAYRWLLSHQDEIKNKRAAVQASRRVSDADLLNTVTWRLDMAQLAGPLLGRVAGLALNPLFGMALAFARATSGKLEDGRRETIPGRPMTRPASSLASRLATLHRRTSSIIAHLRTKEGTL